MTTKVCTKCRVEKELSEFSNNAASKDGLRGQCKTCMREWCAKWRRENPENPEKARERKARWRRENPEKAREASAKWRRENPEKAVEASTRWQRENPEKTREATARWQRENPEKVKEKNARWQRENPETARALARKQVDSLSPRYVKARLGMKDPPQELIDLKREQLLTYRATKELQKTIKEIQHGTK